MTSVKKDVVLRFFFLFVALAAILLAEGNHLGNYVWRALWLVNPEKLL